MQVFGIAPSPFASVLPRHVQTPESHRYRYHCSIMCSDAQRSMLLPANTHQLRCDRKGRKSLIVRFRRASHRHWLLIRVWQSPVMVPPLGKSTSVYYIPGITLMLACNSDYRQCMKVLLHRRSRKNAPEYLLRIATSTALPHQVRSAHLPRCHGSDLPVPLSA